MAHPLTMLIVKHKTDGADPSGAEEAPEIPEGLEEAMKELVSALADKDAKAAADAFFHAWGICESTENPDEEG